MDSTMMAQSMGQAPFYYYSTESKNQQMGMYPMVPTLPSTPVYSRPTSSCSQPPTLLSNGPTSVMTPVASPPSMAHKPSIMLETDFCDNGYFPSTPPLSTTGSAVGSPKSFDMLQTPMNPMFSGMDGFDGVKDVLETAETVLDWSSCGSPPMTPVYLQSNPGKAPSLNNLNTTSDFSSTTSCPSLSPSPPPYARSVASEQDVDFCDPRNLTVSASSNPTLAPEFSLATLEENKVEQASIGATIAPQETFAFNPALPNSLPAFDEFSDLESEDDFVNSLVNLGEHNTSADIGRPRACTGSSVVSLGHGSFIGDEDLSFDENESFQFPSLPSPPCSQNCDEDAHKDKRQKKNFSKKSERVAAPTMVAAAAATEAESPQDQTANTAASESSESNASSGSESHSTPLPAPPTRRGRKQSLTEDPSKTFVCDLCNRRFRRQEHLKRHYRSLHTQEKPFECNECGKKFSRSDNLAQHARTHSGGAIALNLIDEDGQAFDASMMSVTSEDYSSYGKVLFQVASEVPGSASDLSSDDGSDQGEQGKKKRKRSD